MLPLVTIRSTTKKCIRINEEEDKMSLKNILKKAVYSSSLLEKCYHRLARIRSGGGGTPLLTMDMEDTPVM